MTLSAKIGVESAAYKDFVKRVQPRKAWLRNAFRAFITGGLLCILGQGIEDFFITVFHFTEKTAGNPTVAVLIILSVLVTGFGVYDRFAQFAGAGSAVPVTGFANAIASAALEHKSEGYIVGVGTNIFKVAGPVIVFGVVSAFLISLLRYIFMQIIGS